MPGASGDPEKDCSVGDPNPLESEERKLLLFALEKEDPKPLTPEEWLHGALGPMSKPTMATLVAVSFLLILGKVAVSFISHRELTGVWSLLDSQSVVASVPSKGGGTGIRGSQPPGGKNLDKGGGMKGMRKSDGMAESLPSPIPKPEDTSHLPRLAIPLFNARVGAGNQLVEFSSIALFARTHNFSVCVPHLYLGPSKHRAHYPATWVYNPNGPGQWGYKFEHLFNLTELARFVRLVPMEECMATCDGNLTGYVEFRSTRGYVYDRWTPSDNRHCCPKLRFLQWLSVKDMLFKSIPNGCISMGSIFPGLIWRGAYLASYAFLQPSLVLDKATGVLLRSLLGPATRPYLAVHWRFEESSGCLGHMGGLCFIRCPHGVIVADSDIPAEIVANGSHVAEHEWVEIDERGCPPDTHHIGVKVTAGDIAAALVDAAQTNKLDTIFLASDGWIRGQDGCSTMQEVIEEVRRHGIAVVGLWQCPSFNGQFADGANVTFESLDSLFSDMLVSDNFRIGSQALTVIEQEVCVRAHTFMGSGQSSWSLSVWRARVAHRKRAELATSLRSNNTQLPQAELDNRIIDELLQDRHMAGMVCENVATRQAVNILTHEFAANTGPDLWLDYMACEARKGKGGHCIVGACW